MGVKVTEHSSGDVIVKIPGQQAGKAVSSIQDIMVEINKA
jgi:uncharacterized FlaG/YvyC family protein